MSQYPTFIIIGAMKGGTTSLYEYLATHPEVSVSSAKETNYFVTEDKKKDWDWYLSLFDVGAKAKGEASPSYTKRHLWSGTAERIAKTLPDAKLIYIVRDPVKRILSHYVHNYAHGRERKPFSKAIKSQSNYVKTSMYGYQLEDYLHHFSRDRILIVDSDDLRSETDATLQRVFKHIEVQADVTVPNAERTFHASSNKLRRSTLDRRVKGKPIRRALRPILPAHLSEPQPFDRPEPTEEELDYLTNILRPDIEKFRAQTGRSFANWSV